MHRAFSLLAVLALAACREPVEPKPQPEGDPSLQRFKSCDELRSYVSHSWTEYLVQSVYGSDWGVPAEDDSSGGADGDGEGGADSPSDWSDTNVQEEGVDEPDLVKTDGDYLYIIENGELSIVDAWPAEETHRISTLALEGQPFASFLYQDRLAVLSHWYSWEDRPTDEGAAEVDAYPYTYAVRISVIDVSDPAAPDTLREIDVEGWYTGARMIGSDLYLVAQTPEQVPDGLWQVAWDGDALLPDADLFEENDPNGAETLARAVLRPEVAALVDDMPIEELLPSYRDGVPGEDAAMEPACDCTDLYRTEGLTLPATVVLAHIDLAEGEAGSAPTTTGIIADGSIVYASQESLYIAQTSWWWFEDDPTVDTQVHKFTLAGADSVYEGSGEVEGWLLNQFSLGEHEGFLRMATTDSASWWAEGGAVDVGVAEPVHAKQEPANNIFVLEQQGSALEVVGSLRGLAPNEQIYSARFMGDRGFLVTFRQMDPLFTLDLSNPHDPRLVGELEITGYSSYLHPVGTDHLLTVGMEGTPEGQILGFAVSLFDVSDLSSPRLDARLVASSDDWSWSEALYDHHAFTFHNGVLSVPLYTYDYNDETGDWQEFSGLWVIDVDESAGTLREIGRIDHSDLVGMSECIYGDWEGCSDYYWYAWVRRSVVIESWLYSISDYGIKVNEHEAPENEVAYVLFSPKD